LSWRPTSFILMNFTWRFPCSVTFPLYAFMNLFARGNRLEILLHCRSCKFTLLRFYWNQMPCKLQSEGKRGYCPVGILRHRYVRCPVSLRRSLEDMIPEYKKYETTRRGKTVKLIFHRDSHLIYDSSIYLIVVWLSYHRHPLPYSTST
jgi:hypothetical protein